MAIALTTIFGTEINVVVEPRDVERLYAGFPGAHGVTTMFMGSRGRKVVISGRIATAGANYNAARINCQIAIDSIEAFLWAPAGTPFAQARVHDFSSKYHLQQRTFADIYYGGPLPADEVDATALITDHLDALRLAYKDLAISGLFVLDRLWAGDGAGTPAFLIGDGIEGITGRGYSLSARTGDANVYPEIVQIGYLPGEQRMQLITRDLRLAEVAV